MMYLYVELCVVTLCLHSMGWSCLIFQGKYLMFEIHTAFASQRIEVALCVERPIMSDHLSCSVQRFEAGQQIAHQLSFS
jgi:hypothetical protein